MSQECYEVTLHFKDYKDAKALVDANWDIDAATPVWKIELRITKDRPL